MLSSFLLAALPSTVLATQWSQYDAKNCYEGHGATEIDTDGIPGIGADACKAKCDEIAACTGITVGGNGDCYRRSNVQIQSCVSDSYWTTYVAETPTPSPSPTGTCSTSGGDCLAKDLGSVAGSSAEDCCTACQNHPGCGAAVFVQGGQYANTCFLKSACDPTSGCSGDSCTAVIVGGGPTPAPTPPSPSPSPSPKPDSYAVTKGNFKVSGYVCGDRSTSTNIYYPQGAGTFHVVVYGHGDAGGMDCGEDALYKVASTGLIVIAPNTRGYNEKCSGDEYKDMLLALATSKAKGGSLHAGLAQADFSRTGLWGYSMGGKTASLAAQQHKEYNIKAVLLMHGARHSSKIHIPAMFTTGTKDGLEGPSVIHPQFDKDTHLPKIYVNLNGANHLEPSHLGRLNMWGGYFLSCHVRYHKKHCDMIYKGALCAANSYHACIIKGSSPFDLDYEEPDVEIA